MDDVIYYPNLQYPELRQAIGSHFNLSAEDVFVGNGAVQMIFDIIAMALHSKHALVLALRLVSMNASLTRAGITVSHFGTDTGKRFSGTGPSVVLKLT